ncbi:hypothetical protein HDV00_001142 [Rhizophlyctis rosea]|nr:hypothetical protein HDV00_001142 [Rhizophlyctis rosea]
MSTSPTNPNAPTNPASIGAGVNDPNTSSASHPQQPTRQRSNIGADNQQATRNTLFFRHGLGGTWRQQQARAGLRQTPRGSSGEDEDEGRVRSGGMRGGIALNENQFGPLSGLDANEIELLQLERELGVFGNPDAMIDLLFGNQPQRFLRRPQSMNSIVTGNNTGLRPTLEDYLLYVDQADPTVDRSHNRGRSTNAPAASRENNTTRRGRARSAGNGRRTDDEDFARQYQRERRNMGRAYGDNEHSIYRNPSFHFPHPFHPHRTGSPHPDALRAAYSHPHAGDFGNAPAYNIFGTRFPTNNAVQANRHSDVDFDRTFARDQRPPMRRNGSGNGHHGHGNGTGNGNGGGEDSEWDLGSIPESVQARMGSMIDDDFDVVNLSQGREGFGSFRSGMSARGPLHRRIAQLQGLGNTPSHRFQHSINSDDINSDEYEYDTDVNGAGPHLLRRRRSRRGDARGRGDVRELFDFGFEQGQNQRRSGRQSGGDSAPGNAAIPFRPATTIHEHRDTIKIYMDLPGVRKDDIEIEVIDGGRCCVVWGKREAQETEDENEDTPQPSRTGSRPDTRRANVNVSDLPTRMFGEFEVVVPLARSVDASKATTDLVDGVLELVFPKRDGERIKVQ